MSGAFIDPSTRIHPSRARSSASAKSLPSRSWEAFITNIAGSDFRYTQLAALTYKPAAFAEVERLAKAICNGNTDPLLFDQALVIAENEMVLRCVRVEAIALIERLRDITVNPLSRDNSLTRAKARFGQARLQYRQLVRAQTKKMTTTTGKEKNTLQEQESEAAQSQATRMQKPIRSRDEFDALRLAMPDLDRLARYERRAWSRQKRAVREFIEIKSRRES